MNKAAIVVGSKDFEDKISLDDEELEDPSSLEWSSGPCSEE